MANLLDKIYSISPVWIQNFGINLYGLYWMQRRYGGNFKADSLRFSQREIYTESKWNEYQQDQLRKLLIHADSQVPYYQQVFQKSGLTRSDLENFTLKDLEKLPVVTKEILRAEPQAFLASKSQKTVKSYLTSGTTGTPLAIRFTKDGDRLVQAAYESRVRNWAGVNYKMSRAMIGGRIVVPKANTAPPFWRYNWVEKQLYMSAFHISPSTAPDYAKALNHYKPDYLVGYASSHFFLARMLDELHINMYQPKAVLTSSEKLTPEMRTTIEKVYKCEVYDAYSGVEACCQASECEHHSLHISPDVGIVELLDENDQPVPTGAPGRIVATGFLNFAQPLIRYDTGDLAIMSIKECECGRNMPIVEELVGRLEDTVIGKDGRETVRFHGIFVGLDHIREGQIIQEDYDRFTLRLAVCPRFCDLDKQMINDRFYQRLGKVVLNFEFVDQIERTERGKFKAVISKVKRTSVRKG
jgi:phenylacetate-CoA ligase